MRTVNYGDFAKLGIEKEWDIYEVIPVAAAAGDRIEDTRWVIRLDAADGSSIIVQPNDI